MPWLFTIPRSHPVFSQPALTAILNASDARKEPNVTNQFNFTKFTHPP